MTRVVIRGFVKVNCEPSLTTSNNQQACEPVLRRLKSIDGVKDAYKTKNPEADFVAFIEADSTDGIYRAIASIKDIPGVMSVDQEVEMPA